ncbi:hypothetical protein [Sporomusa sp. KB1]|jgi:hypothetical protein|uniref:hypothetical protein n=1 Tax=Sporomusa sp. KB1 TaxID=943346 RepID=UPI0011A03A7F|nr:hypothetical protein [Sporomusa sp. KB1]TWH46412.1 hypothetical protein Salpa_2397 [Sporomusa sp. KB1]
MSEQYLSDFEMGYNYTRKRYAGRIATYSTEYILELAQAFWLKEGSTAELSRGMGFYYLQTGVKKLLLESNDKRQSGKVHNNTNG